MQRSLALTPAPERATMRSVTPRAALTSVMASALALTCLLAGGLGDAALAQKRGAPPAGPPPVGVAPVRQTAVTANSQYIGRIQAIDRGGAGAAG